MWKLDNNYIQNNFAGKPPKRGQDKGRGNINIRLSKTLPQKFNFFPHKSFQKYKSYIDRNLYGKIQFFPSLKFSEI